VGRSGTFIALDRILQVKAFPLAKDTAVEQVFQIFLKNKKLLNANISPESMITFLMGQLLLKVLATVVH
jgi:hypothetical protein